MHRSSRCPILGVQRKAGTRSRSSARCRFTPTTTPAVRLADATKIRVGTPGELRAGLLPQFSAASQLLAEIARREVRSTPWQYVTMAVDGDHSCACRFLPIPLPPALPGALPDVPGSAFLGEQARGNQPSDPPVPPNRGPVVLVEVEPEERGGG